MGKRVLIIGFTSRTTTARKLVAHQEEFGAAAALAGKTADIAICYYDQLAVTLSPEEFTIFDYHNKRHLREYDLVIFHGEVSKTYLVYTICAYLAEHGVSFFNDYRAQRPVGKLPQLVDFRANGMPFPRTLFLLNTKLIAGEVKANWQFPLIVKAVTGSHGNDNFLVKNGAELQRRLATHAGGYFIIQEYIPNDRDYRVLVMGDEALVIERRGPAKSHLNNLAQGATIQMVPVNTLPASVISHSAALAAQYGMTIAGLDVIYDASTGQYFFLEINSQPGWRTLESAVQPTLSHLLAKYL